MCQLIYLCNKLPELCKISSCDTNSSDWFQGFRLLPCPARDSWGIFNSLVSVVSVVSEKWLFSINNGCAKSQYSINSPFLWSTCVHACLFNPDVPETLSHTFRSWPIINFQFLSDFESELPSMLRDTATVCVGVNTQWMSLFMCSLSCFQMAKHPPVQGWIALLSSFYFVPVSLW